MRRVGQVPPPPKAPPITFTSKPTYYVIPLKGDVGSTVAADVLTKSLADAAKRKPTVVILHVDSPGGRIDEVALLADGLREHSGVVEVLTSLQQGHGGTIGGGW